LKVKDLKQGMLLKPLEGYEWLEIPWRGLNGNVVGSFLEIVKVDSYNKSSESQSPALYLGQTDDFGTFLTPGKQVVLFLDRKMTISPKCWRYITCTF